MYNKGNEMKIKKLSFMLLIGLFVSCGDNSSSIIKTYPKTVTLEEIERDNALLRPTVNTPTIDKIFNTRIQMLDKNDEEISNYPKVQTWNSNMTLMRIGSRLYDAETLKESPYTKNSNNPYSTLCSRTSDYFRWSNKSSDTFFVLNSSYSLIQGKLNSNSIDCTNVIESFSDYETVHIGPHEGNIDENDRYLLLTAKKENDTTIYLILYDISKHSRVWTKVLPDDHWVYDESWSPAVMDWSSVSPSGKYILINNRSKANNTEGLSRYDINFENHAFLKYDYKGSLYSEGGHADMGYDQNHNEVIVQFLTGLGVYSFNLDHPNELGQELLGSPYGGGHVSCRNTKRDGWCYITTNVDSNGNGLKRIFALKLDGTGDENVENFSQTYINDDFGATFGGASPDGTKMIFNSHWDTDNIDTFVVDTL